MVQAITSKVNLRGFESCWDRRSVNIGGSAMESVIVEIRAGEGGDDAKALVLEQFAVYARLVERLECL